MLTRSTKQRSQQTGQSLTQYLILMFVMTLGSLTAFGQFSNKGQHQVAMVAGEIAGKSGAALGSSAPSTTPTNQSNSPYAGAGTPTGSGNPSAPTGTASNNPVTNPTGGNTTPAVPSNTAPTPVANNPVTHPSNNNGSTQPPSNNNQDNSNQNGNTTDNGVGNTTGQTDLGGATTTETEPEPKPLCTKQGSDEEASTPEEDNKGAKEEDKGFWGSLWDEVKSGLTEGYEFVKGFWEGMKKQVADLGNLLAHPIDTAKGLIELGKQFVKDPEGTAKMIADSLGDEFKTLALCGSFDKGRVIGENVSPAFMVKLASKMAKFGDLATALKKTKKDFGCASFAAGTPIWTPDGKVNIETLVKGNTVLSRARISYEDTPQHIEKTFGRTAPLYYQLTTEFGTINVTKEHPMWKQGIGWTEVQYLKVDDVVASADGDVLILDNQKVEKPIQVYNFSVKNTPSYFAGAGKLWVHNASTVCSFETINGVRHIVTEIESYNGKSKILNKPEPSTIYKVNGRHTFRTDKRGRPVSVQSTVELKDLDTTSRNYYRQCKIGKCGNTDDEGGHLIATKLGGPGEVINLVPQNRNLNRSAWKKMEIEWANAALDGKKVEIDIQLIYSGDSKRPDKFIVKTKIDGIRQPDRPFDNKAGG